MIELYGVTKRYPGGQIGLLDVDLEIEAGQLCFLTGPSGAGKTTFLELIYREQLPTEGQILVNGRNVSSLPPSKIPYLRRTIGVVFQDFRLIPRKTVFENVTYLLRILGVDAKSQREQAYDTLRQVGLAHRMKAFPQQLSGGEQQRVAIARALINRPDILLADEPTGNLDPALSEEILRLLLEINREGTTIILATHDRSLIERVGHRVLTLDQGRLVGDKIVEGTGLGEARAAHDETDEIHVDAQEKDTDEAGNDDDEEMGPEATGPVAPRASTDEETEQASRTKRKSKKRASVDTNDTVDDSTDGDQATSDTGDSVADRLSGLGLTTASTNEDPADGR